MNLQLSNSQHRFVVANTRGRIFIGGIGSGKSYALCVVAILEALKSRSTCIISFSYRTLKDVIAVALTKICEAQDITYDFNKSEMNFYVNNNPIMLRSADNPERLRGLNLSSVLCDEASSLTREVFDILLGRLRESADAFWAMSTTPKGKNYVYKIIEEEGLTNVFTSGYEVNNSLTVVLQATVKSPFLPDEYIKDLIKQYTSSFAAQELYGQIIENNSSILNPSWFKLENLSPPTKGIRLWDLAVSTKTSADYSAGCLMSVNNGKYYINDIQRVKLAYPDLKKLIIETAAKDGTGIHIGIEVSGQQQAILDDLRRDSLLSSFTLKPYRPTKDKVTRAYPLASQAELGNVIVNNAPWNRCFFDECGTFNAENIGNSSYHDDQVDACTGAYEMLTHRSVASFTNLPI